MECECLSFIGWYIIYVLDCNVGDFLETPGGGNQ